MSNTTRKSLRYLLIKVISFIVIIAIILGIAAVLGLHYFMRSDIVKNQLVQQVEQATGRQVTVKDLHWSVWPKPHLEINGAQLSNPKHFKASSPLVAIKHMSMDVELWPLLDKKLVLSDVKAQGIHVHLIKNKQGQVNWQLKAKSSSADSKDLQKTQHKEADQTAQTDKQSSPQGISIHLPSLHIKTSSLAYHNRQSHQQFAMNDIHLKATKVQFNHNFPVELSAVWQRSKPQNDWHINYSSRLEINPHMQFVQIKDGRVLVNPQKTDIAGLPIKAIEGQMKWHAPYLEVPSFSAQLAQGSVAANGKISLKGAQSSHVIFKIQHVHLKRFLSGLFNYKDLEGEANAKAELQSQGVKLRTWLKNLNGEGHVTINNAQWREINLGRIYNRSLALINRVQHSTNHNKSPVSEKPGRFHSRFRIHSGLLKAHKLKFTTPLINITGQGYMHLVSRRLNFNLDVVGMKNKEQFGPTIPIDVTGHASDVNVEPDLQKIAREHLGEYGANAIKTQLKNLQKAGGALKEAGSNVTDKLNKLFP